MRIGGFRLGWLKRRWWVLILCVAGVTAVAVAASRPGPVTYVAEAVLVVRSGATDNTPGSANEANRLAVTYSQLIPLDTGVLEEVAQTLGVARSEVDGRVSVTNDTNTAILRVQYKAPTPEQAIEGATAVAAALYGPSAQPNNFNGLALSRLPGEAVAQDDALNVIPAGVVLGLLLGIVLILALERSRGRIEDDEDLERLLKLPVTALDGLSPSGITALLQRWRSMTPHLRGAVSLVTPAPGYQSLTAEVASVFAATVRSDSDETLNGSIAGVLISGGAPGSWEVGEQVVQQSDVAVLVVPEGMPIADLEESLKVLEGFGVRPVWVLYAPHSLVERARRRYGEGESVMYALGGPQTPLGNPRQKPIDSR